ncbi:c-type cytochrome [Vibrio ulleungensis]|uniref:Cytochrome c n=1 Tax=Vibrio ulleungensis TaxID=2807619 RepID=A0ABS2HJP5_9VIBR|nr:cytochrome c [Vibrio ulleungensis]MBM7036046.1 cytochrome c [Vibrio ulleungensis]
MKKPLLVLCMLLPTLALANPHKEIIEARQGAFQTVEENTDAIGAALRGSDVDWAALAALSAQLVEQTLLLQTAFPEGSTEDSKARTSIWESPDKFKEQLTKLDASMNELNTAVLAQNQSGASAAIKEGLTTCKACHRSYRERR